ncbi:MAG: D-alanine--D-alanine ligase [Sedimentisphaerales bacterium]|jgi:D-alanine-D-alanine ligase|nr:D-alanine--D-alanine ligase [Sedimentisphaerales bacterium]
MLDRPLNVAVLAGGISPERQVSLQSGAAAEAALRQAGHRCTCHDIGPDRLDVLEDPTIDVFFVALHGAFGEDGQLQSIMEQRHLRYTGSGPQACRLAFDKLATKRLLNDLGLCTPRYLVFGPGKHDGLLRDQVRQLSTRYVVKPARQGSSVGVSIVDDPDAVLDICKRTASEFGDCLVEEYIEGRELTVGVLLGRPLPVIEIRPARSFYDYQAKYDDDRTQFMFDTLPADLQRHIQDQAMAVFEGLGMRHLGRIDLILAPSGKAYVLEANAIPGLTDHSLLPKAAMHAGIPFWQMCDQLVRAAFLDTMASKVFD